MHREQRLESPHKLILKSDFLYCLHIRPNGGVLKNFAEHLRSEIPSALLAVNCLCRTFHSGESQVKWVFCDPWKSSSTPFLWTSHFCPPKCHQGQACPVPLLIEKWFLVAVVILPWIGIAPPVNGIIKLSYDLIQLSYYIISSPYYDCI